MSTITAKKSQAEESYIALIHRFPLRPIRTRRQYQEASKLIDELAVRGEADLNAGEADYLTVLTDLMEAYDEAHCPIPPDDRPAHEKLADLAQERGMTQGDLAELLGISRPLANLILNGKRELQKHHIRTLAAEFRVEPGYFI